NRNVGTAKQGHGQDNELTIPNGCNWNYDWKAHWEKLSDYRVFRKEIGASRPAFVVEKPADGFYFALTPWDVIRFLNLLDEDLWNEVELFIWRNQFRKERILSGAWGRIAYWANIDSRLEGAAIFFHSQRKTFDTRWNKNLKPEDAKELERYREAGIKVFNEKRQLKLVSSPETDRCIQLYYTLPHELGHLDDYSKHWNWLDEGAEFGRDDDALEEGERRIDKGTPHYDQKPDQEKEVYAHRFSDHLREKLKLNGRIPFPIEFDELEARQADIDLAWFRV
ncbi:MAG: hypothetical protein GY866_09580, partial [Proteobacteria bacterium]|nr:hypothetical protein [Pseudomonadota bacterium]